jgi:hypothetical protein
LVVEDCRSTSSRFAEIGSPEIDLPGVHALHATSRSDRESAKNHQEKQDIRCDPIEADKRSLVLFVAWLDPIAASKKKIAIVSLR